MRSLAIACGVGLVWLAACGDAPPPPTSMRRDAGPPPECRGVLPEQTVCEGTTAITCDEGGQISSRVECADSGQLCVPGRGCVVCSPGTIACDGETVLRCNADGTAQTRGETCDAAAGNRCSGGGCARLCEQAESERSYLGCDYVAVPTANSELDAIFEFAVVIANPQLVPAVVTISRGEAFSRTVIVPPSALEVVTLPWVEALRRPILSSAEGDSYFSARAADGSYRIRTDVPVTVHQFNPLNYLALRDCESGFDPAVGDDQCNSYTNDASLLLPVHALTGSYLVMSRATHYLSTSRGTGGSPGFVAIANTDEVPAIVTVRTRAHVIESVDGSITAHAPGDAFELTIAPGEVVELLSGMPTDGCPVALEPDPASGDILYCNVGADYDLTGTEIVSAQHLAVFSGHNCAFVPYDRWACDHLEEQLFPTEVLGTSAVSPLAYQQRGEPNLVRVVSPSDDNTITFTPTPMEGPETIVLDRGDSVEVAVSRATRVTGTAPILAARFFVGQDYNGLGTSSSGAPGDPSMGLLVPDAQWRNQYVFLAPDTYSDAYIDVIAAVGARVELDGQIIGTLRDATGTGVTTATLAIRPGVHRITASIPVGVHVYGFGSYTSYLAPAGLDLREIADPL